MADEGQGDQPLAMRALSRMRGDILSLKLAPGEVTSERALEQLYGVSRTPIREALKALIGEGLVVRAERGYAIAPFDLDQLEEIFEYRETVEDAAVRLACQRRTDEALDAIRETIDRGLSEFTPDSWFEAGLDFHVQLAALSGNRFLRDGVQDAVNRTIRARWLVASSEGITRHRAPRITARSSNLCASAGRRKPRMLCDAMGGKCIDRSLKRLKHRVDCSAQGGSRLQRTRETDFNCNGRNA